MVEAIGVAEGLARLRDEVFDAVLIGHERGDTDALDLLGAIRAGSSDDQPVIVLGSESEQKMAALCYEAGGDAYVCVDTTTTRTLIWQVARAAERCQLLDENRRLQQAQKHRLQLEHDEATRLLGQQRAMIDDLEELVRGSAENTVPDLPAPLVHHYEELLRAHVIMGSGNLIEEMQLLSEMLATAGITSAQVMMLHIHVLEDMVRGLGSRSARHVMSRADLLILEVMIKLAEGYRQRYLECVHPPRQRLLPGFDEFPRAA